MWISNHTFPWWFPRPHNVWGKCSDVLDPEIQYFVLKPSWLVYVRPLSEYNFIAWNPTLKKNIRLNIIHRVSPTMLSLDALSCLVRQLSFKSAVAWTSKKIKSQTVWIILIDWLKLCYRELHHFDHENKSPGVRSVLSVQRSLATQSCKYCAYWMTSIKAMLAPPSGHQEIETVGFVFLILWKYRASLWRWAGWGEMKERQSAMLSLLGLHYTHDHGRRDR